MHVLAVRSFRRYLKAIKEIVSRLQPKQIEQDQHSLMPQEINVLEEELLPIESPPPLPPPIHSQLEVPAWQSRQTDYIMNDITGNVESTDILSDMITTCTNTDMASNTDMIRNIGSSTTGTNVVNTRATIGNTGATIGNTGATIGNTGATIGNTGATIGNTGATIGNIGATVGNIGATIGNIGATIGNTGATMGNIRATVGNIGATIGNIGATVGNTRATVGNTGATIGNIEATVGNTRATIANNGATVSNTGTLVSSIGTNVGNTGNNMLRYLQISQLTYIYNKSSSRPNFATNCARLIFTEEERFNSNVNGRGGKQQLDIEKISTIYNTVFQFYPLNNGEDKKTAWGKCIKAIDESGRRIKRSRKTI